MSDHELSVEWDRDGEKDGNPPIITIAAERNTIQLTQCVDTGRLLAWHNTKQDWVYVSNLVGSE